MSLSIDSNTSLFIVRSNLNQGNSSLKTSLQRLSAGLEINAGANGPAAYLVSQQQAAQAAGSDAAVSGASQTVNTAQTANGALSQFGALLTQIRGLALDSVDAGVNDSGATTTDQAIAAYTEQAANGLSGLSNIDVSGAGDAQQALTAVDTAISQVGAAQNHLGAYQANTLESKAADLQATLQNTTAAESVVANTNFAAETSNFAQAQVLAQAGSTVLTDANATSQLILKLLKT